MMFIRLLRIMQPNDGGESNGGGGATALDLVDWHLEHDELPNYHFNRYTVSADNRRDKSSSVPFVALSYTWGEEDNLVQIRFRSIRTREP